MRIGLAITPPYEQPRAIGDLTAMVQRAEADGFATVWATGLPFVGPHDALILLAALSQTTARIELGSFVVPTYPRHPAVLAQQALSLQQLSGNRLTLGIGLSHKPVIEGMFGLDYAHPIRHMREYLTVLMPLLAGQLVDFDGDEYRVHMHPRLLPPDVRAPAVLVAALLPQMLRLAGERADGTAVVFSGVDYLEQEVIPRITQAAKAAGRPTPRVAAQFFIAVTTDPATARTVARTSAPSDTMPSYTRLREVQGMTDRSGLLLIGDDAEVRSQLARLATIGVTDLVAVLVDVPTDSDARERTYQLLVDVARRGSS